MRTDVLVIKLIPSLSSREKQEGSPHTKSKNKSKKKNTHTSYPLAHAFMEDTIMHIIAQMIPTSKAYISCLLVIIIK